MEFLSRQVAADIFVEFLEVAVHCILHVRGVYPSGVFTQKKKYGVPVHMCRHPEVSKYITSVLSSLHPLLTDHQIHKVTLTILNTTTNKPLENFTFEVATPDPVPKTTGAGGGDVYLLRLERSLRDFLLKLGTCDAMLGPIPTGEDITWKLHVHTTDSAVIDLQQKACIEDVNWVLADDTLVNVTDASLVPLKSMDSPIIKMQLYVAETGNKL